MKRPGMQRALEIAAEICALLAIAALCIVWPGAVKAQGLRLEALWGSCEQTRDNPGVWWNGHYETYIDLKTRCYQLGLSQTPMKVRGFDLGWRVAYVNLGNIKTDSVMAALDDQQFLNPTGDECDVTTSLGCVVRTVGGGKAQGYSAGGVVEKPLGDFVLGTEGGVFVYRNEFKIDIFLHPTGVYLHQWNKAKGWLFTPYVGANVRYGWLMLAGRYYQKVTAHKSGCPGCSGVTNGPAWQLVAGVSYPL